MDRQPAPNQQRRSRSSITVRLLVAFVLVSFIPILVLAALSLREAASEPGEAPGGSEPAETSEPGMLAGLPIEYVELGVAGTSLLLAIGTALYVGRTIIRPLRQLEASIPAEPSPAAGSPAAAGR
jgi:hypothetical protein